MDDKTRKLNELCEKIKARRQRMRDYRANLDKGNQEIYHKIMGDDNARLN